ncbi:hypothetical protein [Paenibacillus sp. W2I17]|uniref:hypothetical protein n=1 Tax=Paenibacillus sp. W2I17 TaxID=3042311 RepID=UPI002781F5A4|nr:hypothetical protein [Paenibacillus sp. W2I17]MDQ0660604.1 hypothetical protein [Paenibacillus sp. W2I17]
MEYTETLIDSAVIKIRCAQRRTMKKISELDKEGLHNLPQIMEHEEEMNTLHNSMLWLLEKKFELDRSKKVINFIISNV